MAPHLMRSRMHKLGHADAQVALVRDCEKGAPAASEKARLLREIKGDTQRAEWARKWRERKKDDG